MGKLRQDQVPGASTLCLAESNRANDLDTIADGGNDSAIRNPQSAMVPQAVEAQRILIVDDEASNRSMLSLVLKAAEYHCEETADGVLALEALRSSPCDLVLLDVDMPNMRGTEVLWRLRQNPPCAHLKIIMISGRASADDLANLMLGGADDYIVKPFSATQLKARVRTALQLKREQDRADNVQSHLVGANRNLEHQVHVRDRELMSAQTALVEALADLVAHRDHETGHHLLRSEEHTSELQ